MRAKGQNGFAMVLVLWVVALLMAIIPVFVYSMRSESSAALNMADSSVARGVQDTTALVAAADERLMAIMAGDAQTESFFSDGSIECRSASFPFRNEEGSRQKVLKIIVTARNTETGAEFTLTSLIEQR